jgi:hypothetical protein
MRVTAAPVEVNSSKVCTCKVGICGLPQVNRSLPGVVDNLLGDDGGGRGHGAPFLVVEDSRTAGAFKKDTLSSSRHDARMRNFRDVRKQKSG